MSRIRNAKRDDNENEIVDALIEKGISVTRLSMGDGGVPDLLCSFDKRFFFVEVKGPKGELTKAQKVFIAKHPLCPIFVIRTVGEIERIEQWISR